MKVTNLQFLIQLFTTNTESLKKFRLNLLSMGFKLTMLNSSDMVYKYTNRLASAFVSAPSIDVNVLNTFYTILTSALVSQNEYKLTLIRTNDMVLTVSTFEYLSRLERTLPDISTQPFLYSYYFICYYMMQLLNIQSIFIFKFNTIVQTQKSIYNFCI